jgi:hypothetical protein
VNDYMIQEVVDGSVTFSQRYTRALEADHAYDRFVDYGVARYSREIVLVEPSGLAHSKAFDGPYWQPVGVK